MKGKYKISPLNIISTLIILLSFYCLTHTGGFGFGILGFLLLFPIGLFGLFIDCFIQILSEKRWEVSAIEIPIILIISIWIAFQYKTKELIVNEVYDNRYITIVYGVDGKPKLPKSVFKWSMKINVPQEGIIYTSSNESEDFSNTILLDANKNPINFGHPKYGLNRFNSDTLIINNQTYNYVCWRIEKNCCTSSSKEYDPFHSKLRQQVIKDLLN